MQQPSSTPALVSIHDVMPQTLSLVNELLEECRTGGVDHITLLVVPGLEWTVEQLDELRRWQAAGHELAGHGWVHRIGSIRSLYHWLHSRLLSRDVAEHLSLSPTEVVALINRCAGWFVERELGIPKLYVPPAWAVGALPLAARKQLGFSMLETLTGVSLLRQDRSLQLPLVGFEADTAFRSFFLRRWNAWTIHRARAGGKPLRISLHPHDHRLRLADELRRTLSLPWTCRSYASLDLEDQVP